MKITRTDIQIIAQHSNWSEKSIDTILKKNIYNDKESWRRFLSIFCISLGVGFTTTGIIFFFAYNWANLHKFIKIGLIESLIILSTLIIFSPKINLDIKNILLTGVSLLVGVLFAVFGQIYQTGANAYDVFLGWTISITLWVLISNFAPLWLLFIILINTTLILFSQQVAHDWSQIVVCTLLFIVNLLFLATFQFGKKIHPRIKSPIWFLNILALASVAFGTIGIVLDIITEKAEMSFFVLLTLISILYSIGIIYGLKLKDGFYFLIICFSIIIIISVFLYVKIANDSSTFFLIGLFIIGSITFVIKKLINLNKKHG